MSVLLKLLNDKRYDELFNVIQKMEYYELNKLCRSSKNFSSFCSENKNYIKTFPKIKKGLDDMKLRGEIVVKLNKIISLKSSFEILS